MSERRVERLSFRLLRRHVGRAPHDHAGGCLRRRHRRGIVWTFDELGQAEVQHLDAAVVLQHHVGRLEIAMDDVRGMRARKRLRDLRTIFKMSDERHATARDRLIERAPLDELHHHVGEITLGPEVVTVTMLGCLSAETARASCRKRAWRSWSAMTSARKTFTPRRGEAADRGREDGAHAPFAENARSSYGPTRHSWSERHRRCDYTAPRRAEVRGQGREVRGRRSGARGQGQRQENDSRQKGEMAASLPWLDTLRADVILGWRQIRKIVGLPRPPFSRSRWRSAPASQHSASWTPCCGGHCRSPAPSGCLSRPVERGLRWRDARIRRLRVSAVRTAARRGWRRRRSARRCPTSLAST